MFYIGYRQAAIKRDERPIATHADGYGDAFTDTLHRYSIQWKKKKKKKLSHGKHTSAESRKRMRGRSFIAWAALSIIIAGARSYEVRMISLPVVLVIDYVSTEWLHDRETTRRGGGERVSSQGFHKKLIGKLGM